MAAFRRLAQQLRGQRSRESNRKQKGGSVIRRSNSKLELQDLFPCSEHVAASRYRNVCNGKLKIHYAHSRCKYTLIKAALRHLIRRRILQFSCFDELTLRKDVRCTLGKTMLANLLPDSGLLLARRFECKYEKPAISMK